jgi:hypothetical protein
MANAAPVSAAELHFDAPADCGVSETSLAAQIERIVGRPLSAMGPGEFEVRVRRSGREWQLVLRMKSGAGKAEPAQAPRQIRGATCAEVTDATAVAIALAVQGREVVPWEPVAIESAEASAAAAQPSQAAATQDRAHTPGEGATDTGHSESPGNALRLGLGASALLDGGALPKPTLGAAISFLAEFSAFRAELFGAVFLPQQTSLVEGRGGEFDLLLGGARACGRSAFGEISIVGCAEFEAGQLSGRGLHVRTAHPRSTTWSALGADAGMLWTLVPKLALLFRVGVVHPLSRPDFVLDGTEAVHRAAALTFRAQLGVELYL